MKKHRITIPKHRATIPDKKVYGTSPAAYIAKFERDNQLKPCVHVFGGQRWLSGVAINDRVSSAQAAEDFCAANPGMSVTVGKVYCDAAGYLRVK